MSRAALIFLAALGVTACDDGDGDGGSGPAVNCEARCATKVESCGIDPGLAASLCAQNCGMDITESQLSCVEGTACDDLLSGDPVCGIGDDADGSVTNGGCPFLEGCACGISGVVEINGQCANTCEEACAALGGGS